MSPNDHPYATRLQSTLAGGQQAQQLPEVSADMNSDGNVTGSAPAPEQESPQDDPAASPDATGGPEGQPDELLASIALMQQFVSDLSVLDSDGQSKLVRMECTVDLIKNLHENLERRSQEFCLVQLPFPRFTHGVLQAHAALSDTEDMTARFSKVCTFLQRQIPLWRRYNRSPWVEPLDQPKKTGHLDDLKDAIKEIQDSFKGIQNDAKARQTEEKRVEDLCKAASSDWNHMKFQSVDSLLTAMTSLYTRYFKKSDMRDDETYIKYMVHKLRNLKEDINVPDLETLRGTISSLCRDDDVYFDVLEIFPTRKDLLDFVRSFESPEGRINLAVTILSYIRQDGRDFVTALLPNEEKLMDSVARLDADLMKLWEKHDGDDFLKSLKPDERILISSPTRIIEELLRSWKVEKHVDQSTFISMKQHIDQYIFNTKFPKLLSAGMKYPDRLLRSVLTGSGVNRIIDAHAAHFREQQVKDAGKSAGKTPGLTVAFAETVDDVDGSYDSAHSYTDLLETVNHIQINGGSHEDVVNALTTMLGKCDVCGDDKHLQANCSLGQSLRQQMKDVLSKHTFANPSKDALSRFFGILLRNENIPFPQTYTRRNAGNFGSFRGTRREAAK